ncbi:MAG TPA: dipeptidase PepE [Thermoanaerobaculia bacterium]|nr:dipeptidase PepE [Thermoanaerobaculia bacterium]
MRRLLLISSSRVWGSGYLEHCEGPLRSRLAGVSRLLFVPYALQDWDAYFGLVRERFAQIGLACDAIHRAADPVAAVREAEALFVGGGNTFRLLKKLYELELVPALRSRVEEGIPYVGSSAGTNVATVSIRTTNDMPIVEPPTFEALGLVPFNVNPHYLDPDPGSQHMGETREERIRQFHEENDVPVVGLREGAMLWVEGEVMSLLGVSGARIFRKGSEPVEAEPGARLDELLRGGSVLPGLSAPGGRP